MRRTGVVLVVLVIVVGGCGSSNDEPAGTPQPAAPTTTTSAEAKPSALQGTWRTDPITVADMVKTLREEGLADSIRGFKRNAPIPDAPTELILEIRDGTWDLYGQPEGGPREGIDYDAQYLVEGDTVVVTHDDESNTHRWSVSGDVLSLTWIKTTYGLYKGVPEEAFQRALYMTAEFRRTP